MDKGIPFVLVVKPFDPNKADFEVNQAVEFDLLSHNQNYPP